MMRLLERVKVNMLDRLLKKGKATETAVTGSVTTLDDHWKNALASEAAKGGERFTIEW